MEFDESMLEWSVQTDYKKKNNNNHERFELKPFNLEELKKDTIKRPMLKTDMKTMTNKLSDVLMDAVDERKSLVINHLASIIKGTKWEGYVFGVGGMVRDEIMGKHIKDIDLVIDLPNGGVEFAKWATEQLGTFKEGSNPVIYPTYGTAKFVVKVPVKYDFSEDVECVQTRKEQYHDESSRNPECAYGTLEEDCMRRDLTINALYKNIVTGEIIDLTGKGLDDIKNHIIRTPCEPDVIYSDDPLRMLRCIRFACRYGWDIEKETWEGIKKNVDRIKIISQERITDEINKILRSDYPDRGLTMLLDCGLLQYVLPEFMETINMTQNSYHFGTVWEHTLAVVNKVGYGLEGKLAALFHDIGKIKTKTIDEKGVVHFYRHEFIGAKLAEKIMRRMKYPNDTIEAVKTAILNHMRTKSYGDDCHVSDKVLRKLQSDLGNNYFLTLALIDADNKSHAPEHCLPNQVKLIRERTEEMANDGTLCTKIQMPVNGDDVMNLKNLKPGPQVKEYLEKLKDIFLENPKITREEMLIKIQEL